MVGRASVMGMGVPELHLATGECARSARAEDGVRAAHEAAGHLGKAAMLGMLRQGTIGGAGVTVAAIHGFYQYPCDACAESKTVRASFPANKECRDLSDPLRVVHTDVAGPYPIKSLGGARYSVTLVDSIGWHDVRTIATKDGTTRAVEKMIIRARA